MKYRKKPVVIDAVQFSWRSNPRPVGVEVEWVDGGMDNGGRWHFYINTLEGRMTVNEGDWIITGVMGEKYPCKPNIFEATYEAVAE